MAGQRHVHASVRIGMGRVGSGCGGGRPLPSGAAMRASQIDSRRPVTCQDIPPDSLVVDIWVMRQLALLVVSALVVAVLGVIWSSINGDPGPPPG